MHTRTMLTSICYLFQLQKLYQLPFTFRNFRLLTSFLLDPTSQLFALATSQGKVTETKVNRLGYSSFLETNTLRNAGEVLVTSKTQKPASFVSRRSQEVILASTIAGCQTLRHAAWRNLL